MSVLHFGRALAAGVVAVLLLAGPALAAGPKADKNQDQDNDPLPLTKVVLFNAGVGFFQHSGEIEGDRRIELKFNVDDINDLLKSMVVQAGRISNVTYGSKDPITKTLSTFAIDLTSNPSLADLLDQIRGEKIEIPTRPSRICRVGPSWKTRPSTIGRTYRSRWSAAGRFRL